MGVIDVGEPVMLTLTRKLADADGDNRLSVSEFQVAFQLLHPAVAKRGAFLSNEGDIVRRVRIIGRGGEGGAYWNHHANHK